MAKKKCVVTVTLANGEIKEFPEQEFKKFLIEGGLEQLGDIKDVKFPVERVSTKGDAAKLMSARKQMQSERVSKDIAKQETKGIKAAAQSLIKSLDEQIKMLTTNIKNVLKSFERTDKDLKKEEEGKRKAEKKNQLRDIANKFFQDVKLTDKVSKSTVKTIVNRMMSIDTDEKLGNFINFLNKVISDTAFEAAVEKIDVNRSGAKKRKHNKFTKQVKEFLSVPLFDMEGNQTLTDEELKAYGDAVEALNSAIPNHKLMDVKLSNGQTLFEAVMKAKAVAESTNELAKLLSLDKNAGTELTQLIDDLKKMESAGLLTTFDGYLKFKTKMSRTKRLINDLYANGAITLDQYDSLSESLFTVENGNRSYDVAYEDEINTLKGNIFDRVSDYVNNTDTDSLTSVEKDLFERIKRLVNNFPNFVNELSVEELNLLEMVAESAMNGFVPEYQANSLINKMEVKGMKVVDKIKGPLSKLTSKFPLIKNLQSFLQLHEAQNYEGLAGILKSSAIFEFIINATDKAVASMRKFQTDLTNSYFKSLPTISNKKKNIRNKFSAGILGHILEHGFNASSKDQLAIDYIGEQLKDEAVRRAYGDDIELIEDIYKQLLSNPNFLKDGVNPSDATFGDLDYAKIYEAYTNKSSRDSNFDPDVVKTYEAARKVFEQTAPYAISANALRNMNGMSNPMYIPWNYLSGATGTGDVEADFQPGQNPISLRAGATYMRLKEMPLSGRALNFNMDSLVNNHISEVTRDYFLTNRVKQLNEIRRELKASDDVSNVDLQTFDALRDNEVSRMQYELSKGNSAFNKLTSAAALKYLVGTRVAVETITNLIQLSFRSITSPIALIRSALPGRKARVQKIMEFTNSPLIEKTKFRSTNHATLSGGRVLQKESNLKKVNEFLNGLSEGLFTSGMWMPEFEKHFFELTGEKWDDAMMSNPKYFYDIQSASARADKAVQSILRGAFKAQTRQQILLGIQVPYANKFFGTNIKADSGMGQFLGFFQGFLYNDFQQAVIGSREIADGQYSSGFRRVVGVTANLLAYSLLRSLVTNALELAWGDDDDKKKAQKELEKLSSFEGMKDYAWSSVMESMVTFWSASQNVIGRYIVDLALQSWYASTKSESAKKEIEDMMGRMYMKPFKSSKDITEEFVPPGFKEVSKMVWNEIDAMAGEQNVSVTTLITRISNLLKEGKEGELTPREVEAYQLLASLYYATSLVTMGYGSYLPGNKEIKNFVDKQIDNASMIGGRDIWDAAGIAPKKELKINDFTEDTNKELSGEATVRMNEILDMDRGRIDQYIQEGNSEALKYELFRAEHNAINYIYEQQGLNSKIELPRELPPFDSVKDSNKYSNFRLKGLKKATKDIATDLLTDEELNNALTNSSPRTQAKYKELYLEDRAKAMVLGKEAPKLEDYGIAQEVDSDGNVIRFYEVSKK